MVTRNLRIDFEPRPWQRECMAKMKRFTVLALHRRAGKTTLAVAYLITAALSNIGNYAYISPQKNQSKTNMWDIIKHMLREFLEIRGNPVVEIRESDLTVRFKNGSKLYLLGAEDPDKIRGAKISGAVVDEVAQMPREIWFEILRPALMDSGGFTLFIGTPKGVNLFSDLFDRGCNPEYQNEWISMRYTCYDTAVLSPIEIENYRKEVDDNTFRREMLCDFSASGEDQLISLEDVNRAMERIPDTKLIMDMTLPLIMGVDVSRYGNDRSVIFFRRGLVAEQPLFTSHCSTTELANFVLYHYSLRLPDVIFVDGTGVGGGVVDILTNLGLPTYDINFSSRSFDPRYKNRRTEMWCRLAEWIKKGGYIYPDEKLKQELATPLYQADEGGKLALESKKDIRLRLGQSPDLADALALTFAEDIQVTRNLKVRNINLDDTGYQSFRSKQYYGTSDLSPIQRFEERAKKRGIAQWRI